MRPLKICYVTPELTPLAKVGGLADVSAALPRALTEAGHDVRVFLPLYSQIDRSRYPIEPVAGLPELALQFGPHKFAFSLGSLLMPGGGPTVYLVHCPALYDRSRVYTHDADEHLRFLLLSRAALEVCQRWQWSPDIVHCHDWQTAMLPLYLKSVYAWDGLFAATRSLLTIHNLGYQGMVGGEQRDALGLDGQLHLLHQEDLREGRINLLKTGLLYADALSTVSPTYAQEIQTPAFGMGLEDLLRQRRTHLVGILNGIDPKQWHPRTDPWIPFRYSAQSLWRKAKNKEALQADMGLPVAPGAPLLGIVSRLTAQKGFDLAREALPQVLSTHPLQLVVLGSGEAALEGFFHHLGQRFPHQVRFYSGFHEELAHRIEAGADMFLMPSQYEPCGLNQMYSQAYGTVPIVRKTGGLADSVIPYDPPSGEGTGIVFEHYDVSALRWALHKALDLYSDRGHWRRMVLNGMAQDFSWATQAQKYVDLYHALTP